MSRPPWYHPQRWALLPRWQIVLVTWGIVITAAGLVVGVGSALFGGLAQWNTVMATATPWWLLWRLVLYVTVATLYLRRWRPRILARVTGDQDGGQAARYRLRRCERACLMVVVVLDAMHLPKILTWLAGD